jgi:hypothetical protein
MSNKKSTKLLEEAALQTFKVLFVQLLTSPVFFPASLRFPGFPKLSASSL